MSTVGTQDWTEACRLDELVDGQPRTAAGVTLVRNGDAVHACGARCPHMGYPMVNGTVRDGVITCAWHKWEFDLRSGGCYRGACDDLAIYPVEIRDGTVFVAKTRAGDRDEGERQLREGLMMGDPYLQAKAAAQLQRAGTELDRIVAIGVDAAFAHSVGAHQSMQAVREAGAVVNAGRLAQLVGSRQQLTVLLQGLRMAAGRVGDRPAVTPLPPPWDQELLFTRLEDYVDDSSALGVERILLTLLAAGTTQDELATRCFDLASRAWFVDDRNRFIAVVDALEIARAAERPEVFAALCAWVLGAPREEPDADGRDAQAWLKQHASEVAAVSPGAADIDQSAVDELITINQVAPLCDKLLGWLNDGIAPGAIIDGISLLCARRVARLWPNNGGMWGSAINGLRLVHAWRRAAQHASGAHQVQALFLIVFYLFESRWLVAGKPWEAVAGDGARYAESFGQLENDAARANAVALLESGERADLLGAWLAPLVEEDLGIDQLATLVAALAEQEHQQEWQPYIAGMVTWIMDGKAGQEVLAAARFGRSFTA